MSLRTSSCTDLRYKTKPPFEKQKQKQKQKSVRVSLCVFPCMIPSPSPILLRAGSHTPAPRVGNYRKKKNTTFIGIIRLQPFPPLPCPKESTCREPRVGRNPTRRPLMGKSNHQKNIRTCCHGPTPFMCCTRSDFCDVHATCIYDLQLIKSGKRAFGEALVLPQNATHAGIFVWTELSFRLAYISDHGLGIVCDAVWRTWGNQGHRRGQDGAYPVVANP